MSWLIGIGDVEWDCWTFKLVHDGHKQMKWHTCVACLSAIRFAQYLGSAKECVQLMLQQVGDEQEEQRG